MNVSLLACGRARFVSPVAELWRPPALLAAVAIWLPTSFVRSPDGATSVAQVRFSPPSSALIRRLLVLLAAVAALQHYLNRLLLRSRPITPLSFLADLDSEEYYSLDLWCICSAAPSYPGVSHVPPCQL